MSGSIGRSYLIQSWNDASSYSGEQIHNRLSDSKELHMINGKANTKLYEEKELKKNKRSIRDKIIPQSVRLDNIEKLILELETEYKNKSVSYEEYVELKSVLDKKHKRAYELLSKALSWEEENSYENDEFYTKSLTEGEDKSRVYSNVDGNSIFTDVFMVLKDDNLFKQAYIAVRQTSDKLSRIYRRFCK